MKQYYEILGIPNNSSRNDVKKAYYRLAKKFHPDICKEKNCKEKFIAINEAYELLTTPSLRIKSRIKKTPNASSSQKHKARQKANVKAKMSSEEFKVHRQKKIRIEKNNLVKAFFSMVGFELFIYYSIWNAGYIGPGDYYHTSATDFFYVSLIIICLILVILAREFFITKKHRY